MGDMPRYTRRDTCPAASDCAFRPFPPDVSLAADVYIVILQETML